MAKSPTWTKQEDEMLQQIHYEANCFQRWKYISQKLKQRGILKSELECRERFMYHLNPDFRKDKLTPEELKLLFSFYDQYGPLWSVFQSLIPGRNQNLLKNKFYSTLRSLIRIILLASTDSFHESSFPSSSTISTKHLTDIFEGKKNFRKFKPLLRTILKDLDYQVTVEKISILKSNFSMKSMTKFKEDVFSLTLLKQKKIPTQNFAVVKNIEPNKKQHIQNFKQLTQIIQDQPIKIEEGSKQFDDKQLVDQEKESNKQILIPIASERILLTYWAYNLSFFPTTYSLN